MYQSIQSQEEVGRAGRTLVQTLELNQKDNNRDIEKSEKIKFCSVCSIRRRKIQLKSSHHLGICIAQWLQATTQRLITLGLCTFGFCDSVRKCILSTNLITKHIFDFLHLDEMPLTCVICIVLSSGKFLTHKDSSLSIF